MSEIIKQTPVVKGVVADYFALESHLLSTRSADLHKAVDRSRDESVLLWIMRHPLSLQGDSIERFLARLSKLQLIPAIGQHLLNFAVDSTGVAFASLKPLDGAPLDSGIKGDAPSRAAVAESERRFVGCIRQIEAIHNQGFVCGDISTGSFWVDRAGEIAFIGVMGSFDGDAQATSMLPPPEVSKYIAPEQLAGSASPASDVYALGVLGYYLLSGKSPFGAEMGIGAALPAPVPLGEAVAGAPLWAEEVLACCLQADPAVRYPGAGEMLKGVAEARQRAFSQADLPARKSGTVPGVRPGSAVGAGGRTSSGSGNSLTRGPVVGRPAAPETNEPAGPEDSPVGLLTRMRLPIVVVAVFLISAVVGAQLTSRSPGSGQESLDAEPHRQAVIDSPEMQRALEVGKDPKAELGDAAARFDQLVSSDDPLAHVILVKSAVDAQSPEIRALAERSLVQRVRRLGMLRSAEQLNQWLRTIATGTTPAAYDPLLKALNATLPLDARTTELRKAYVADQRTTLRIAASIALDSQQTKDYQELLAQLVGDSLALEDAPQHSALALIMAHPELAVIFGDDIVQRRTELPDLDVLWLLGILGTRNDYNVRAFASLAVERGILPPLRQEYLAVVRDRQDVPPEVLNALVKAAAGAMTAEDVSEIGRWFDRDVERILLLVCADVSDEALLLEAFDILAGKSLTVQPSATLVDWVRRNAWENRAQYVRAIGVLGNLGKVKDEDAKDAFRAFEPLLKDPRVVRVMLESNDPFVTKLILERYSDSLGLGALLNMLHNRDREVRMLALQSLKNYNDVGALKLIIDSYEKETDESVRKAYRDNFWMIREREEKGK